MSHFPKQRKPIGPHRRVFASLRESVLLPRSLTQPAPTKRIPAEQTRPLRHVHSPKVSISASIGRWTRDFRRESTPSLAVTGPVLSGYPMAVPSRAFRLNGDGLGMEKDFSVVAVIVIVDVGSRCNFRGCAGYLGFPDDLWKSVCLWGVYL